MITICLIKKEHTQIRENTLSKTQSETTYLFSNSLNHTFNGIKVACWNH